MFNFLESVDPGNGHYISSGSIYNHFVATQGNQEPQGGLDSSKKKKAKGNHKSAVILPSLKLTCHLNMDGWKTSFHLGCFPGRCYVGFREGIHVKLVA